MSLRASAIMFWGPVDRGNAVVSAPLELPQIVIWSAAGVLAALAWYWLMGLWLEIRAK